jgi:hypothetical protein
VKGGFVILTAMARDFEFLTHFTPTAEQRRALAKSGAAMPDGSFYIRNRSELSDAIQAVGRATPNAGESDVARRNAVRRHIIKRANALNLSSMIPDTWNSDGTLKQSSIADEVEEFLKHYGVRGMHWGVRRSPRPGHGQLSPDAARARQLQTQVRRSGTQSLSNRDLQTLVTRLNLETQFGRVNQAHVGQGRRFVEGLLIDFGKQTATALVNKYAAQGASHLAKLLTKK